MSYTNTPNYALKKPNVNSDNDVWGDHWNQNADALDSIVHGIDTRAQVTSFNTRTGAVTLTAADVTAVGFATTTTNDASYINASGDTMTGSLALAGNAVSALQAVPLQQLNAALPQPGSATPGMDSVGAAGTSTLYARQDHIHPTDTSRYAASNPSGYQTAAQVTTALAPYAPLASPAFTGNPTAPTPTAGDNDTSIATTAFVTTALSSAAAAVTIGDTPPASPQPGNLWWNSAQTGLNIYYNDGNSAQWVVANNQNSLPDAASDGAIYGRQNAAWAAVAPATSLNNTGRNLVMNGAFAVAQRGAGPWTTLGIYTLDRWVIGGGAGDTATVAQAAASDANRANIGDEAATNLFNCTFTGAAGAGNFVFVQQPVEDVRRLAGKTVTVSFYANSGTASMKIGVSLDQLFGSGGSPSADVNGTGQAVTLSATAGQFARYSVSFSIPSISGKTLGSNGNSRTALNLWLSSGTTNASRAGNIGVQSGVVNLWGVQLEIGTVATPFDAGGTPADQFRQCQRFYQVIVGWSGAGYSTSGTVVQDFLYLSPPMRAQPTVSVTWGTNTNYSPTLGPFGSGLQVSGTTTGTGQWGFNVSSATASADL